ncbi:MAG: hypothetical protein AABY04_01410 [Candidatus Micrarchaeota archaeon]
MQKMVLLFICLLLFGCSQPSSPNFESFPSPIASNTIYASSTPLPTITNTPIATKTVEEMTAECKKFTLPTDCNEVPANNGGDFCRKCREIGIIASISPSNTIQTSAIPSNPPSQIIWQYFDEWKPNASPPNCEEKFIRQSPVDFSKATSILYPGQIRGGNYKPHGGIRYDYANAIVEVRSPMDGYITRGSRYFEKGAPQFLFDIISPCGIMNRFEHLFTLSPKFAKAAEKFPPAIEGDTRTTEIEPIEVKAGELIATQNSLGYNPGLDWGVYDLRKMNEASKDSLWLSDHGGQLAPYALCWLNLLSPSDTQKVLSLPAGDSISGKQSDYC